MGDCEMTSDLIDEGKELVRRGIWIFVTAWRRGTVQSRFRIGSDLKNLCVVCREKEAAEDRRWREQAEGEC